MKKRTNFAHFDWEGWPQPAALAPFFLAPKGQEWCYDGGNDSWGLDASGLCGTEHLAEADGVKAHLHMVGNPNLGVYLIYSRWDGREKRKITMNSRGISLASAISSARCMVRNCRWACSCRFRRLGKR
jgi:hypothetical protein